MLGGQKGLSQCYFPCTFWVCLAQCLAVISKKTNWLQHRAKQHFLVRLGFLSVDSRAAMRCILTGGHGFSALRVLYLQGWLDEGERLFSQRRYVQWCYVCFVSSGFKKLIIKPLLRNHKAFGFVICFLVSG